ncbi:hypothetical protein CEXT_11911 [Caerostris extrusa]|uniref:Uncharacterized protein n=1 Tax=Caerostris extrusa TaxID=172846 RepID=A0AAV4UUW7_CAEEX|nr:hypothetical protein CEXT_11911 [Caerostris extrusa]
MGELAPFILRPPRSTLYPNPKGFLKGVDRMISKVVKLPRKANGIRCSKTQTRSKICGPQQPIQTQSQISALVNGDIHSHLKARTCIESSPVSGARRHDRPLKRVLSELGLQLRRQLWASPVQLTGVLATPTQQRSLFKLLAERNARVHQGFPRVEFRERLFWRGGA